MGGGGKSQSGAAGKTGKSASASELLSGTTASSLTAPYDKEDDDPILATLKRTPLKKRSPAAKWDGRVSAMSLQEYRERKWSIDAAYGKVERRGPTFSIRRQLPSFLDLGKKNTNFSVGDVAKAFDATLRSPPSFSMGIQYSCMAPDLTSQGPAEYSIPSTMDPSSHPTIPKNSGARFGSEVLQPRDPTGPAPGDYDPDAVDNSSTLKRPPKVTIQGREAWRPPTQAPGPGVGEYDISKAVRTGKLTPITWGITDTGAILRAKKEAAEKKKTEGKTVGLETLIDAQMPLGSGQYETPGPAHYNGPGTRGQSFRHPMRHNAPIWKFGSEPRGLRT